MNTTIAKIELTNFTHQYEGMIISYLNKMVTSQAIDQVVYLQITPDVFVNNQVYAT